MILKKYQKDPNTNVEKLQKEKEKLKIAYNTVIEDDLNDMASKVESSDYVICELSMLKAGNLLTK